MTFSSRWQRGQGYSSWQCGNGAGPGVDPATRPAMTLRTRLVRLPRAAVMCAARSAPGAWASPQAIAGFLLLMLGFVGLALRQRGVEPEPLAFSSDQGPSEPEADLDQVEAYN